MAKSSKCIFCGSVSYGKGCLWSHFKNNVHLHSGDGTKCSFCGSSVKVGPGCPHSPSGTHMSGANFFNGMAKESFIVGYLMNLLSTPIHETQAFRLGIIDADGNLVKKPETLSEKMAYSSIDAYILKLKKLLGSRTDLLNTEIYLETVTKNAELPIELYESEVIFKNYMTLIMKHFKEAIDKASEKGLPSIVVQKIILESLKEL